MTPQGLPPGLLLRKELVSTCVVRKYGGTVSTVGNVLHRRERNGYDGMGTRPSSLAARLDGRPGTGGGEHLVTSSSQVVAPRVGGAIGHLMGTLSGSPSEKPGDIIVRILLLPRC